MFAQLTRRALLAGAGVAAAALLAACGAGDDSPTAPDAKFNDADVTFAQNMIPHHEQAVEMAKLAPTRASNPEVKRLASQIEEAQDPEIKTLRGWLKDWGKPETPEGGHTGMNGMDGMMSEEEMKRLEAARGAEFDRMFARMMIAHHQGAIKMAETEIADGVNPDAKKLARTIKRTQAEEVKTLKGLLARL
ncbi:MAG: DUF305 domain-containing protein [Micromonosporaceae bacterium]|nr:DUF305 domain-containing protein [Micromonosporaceae bacterium]